MNKQTKQLVSDALAEYYVYLAARDRQEPDALRIAAQALPAVRIAARAVIIHPRMPAKASVVLYALEHLEHVIDTQEVI